MSLYCNGARTGRRISSTLALASTLIGTAVFFSNAQTVTDPPTRGELASHIDAHAVRPEDYIVGKFKDHDIVLLGEMHRVKHDVVLVQALIPRLYTAGVYVLGMEFANYADQSLIDSLVTAPQYDEAMARRVMFDMWPTWGYVEYMDIFRAAWRLNHALPAGARRFRVLGLNYAANYALLTGPIGEATDAQRKEIFFNGDGDAYMARVAFDEIVSKGEKALLYTGIHHAFTRFRQPNYDYASHRLVNLVANRMSNYLYRRLGERIFLVALHRPWPATVSETRFVAPVGGEIDSVLSRLRHRSVGFDIVGTPFGRLGDTSTVYSAGHPGFVLADFCDGYVYQGPFEEYEGVTTDTLFVTPDNLGRAVQNIANFEARSRYTTPADFVRVMRQDADIQAVFSAWGIVNPRSNSSRR